MFLSTCDCYSRTAYGVTCYIYVAKILFDVMWQNRGIEKPVLTKNQMQGPWFEPAVLYDNHQTTNHSQSYSTVDSECTYLNIYTQIESKLYFYGKSDYNSQNKRLHKEIWQPESKLSLSVVTFIQHAVSLLPLLLWEQLLLPAPIALHSTS